MADGTGVAQRGQDLWPALPYADWRDTLHGLHMWMQVVGKIQLALTPLTNHWWNSALAVTPRGLGTAMMSTGTEALRIDFDLVDHVLVIVTSRGRREEIPLGPMSVAEFFRRVIDALVQLDVSDPHITPVPVEVPVAVPFAQDREIRPYDRENVERFRTILVSAQIVFERFRSEFLGKASPVHFFWGSFDLASARFSGRRAPAYTGGNAPNVNIHVMHEAYSHELIAAGFWPGNDDAPQAEFYSYPVPALAGLAGAKIAPDSARWVDARGEFILSYEAVRTAADPAAALLDFLRSTYEVSADLAGWDRPLLEERAPCECAPTPPSRTAQARKRYPTPRSVRM